MGVLWKCVLSIKVPIRNKSENLSYAPRILHIYLLQILLLLLVCVFILLFPMISGSNEQLHQEMDFSDVCQKPNVSDFLVCPFLNK